jgi:hypothetical protein
MNKFRRSWLLFKSSVSVIGKNPKLLVFPIVIAGFVALIALFFLAPLVFKPTGFALSQGEHWQAVFDSLFERESPAGEASGERAELTLTPTGVVFALLIYFASMFFATFFNVAFMNEILAALQGGGVSIRRGLRFAWSRLGAIVLWTIFAGLVGLLIQFIEERFKLVGRLVARFIGLAWSIACVFVIPVLVREQAMVNPFAVLRKSAEALRRTWGEALIGYVGLQFGSGLVLFGSLLFLGGAVAVAVAVNNYWILLPVGLLWLLAICAFAYLGSVASQVYRGALYLYAAEGVVPAPYDKPMLDMAWKIKKA